jgi:hypothetical protein
MLSVRVKPRDRTAPDDARYLGTVKIEYTPHPLGGQEFQVVRRDLRGPNGQVLVETTKGRQCLPAWMTDRTLCAALTFGWQPFVSQHALLELDALLTALDQRDRPPKLDS